MSNKSEDALLRAWAATLLELARIAAASKHFPTKFAKAAQLRKGQRRK